MMNLSEQLLGYTSVNRAWQSPFIDQKFAPVLAHNDLTQVRRVLDVGCGPGTNTASFPDCDYHGIDCNEKYVEYARRKYSRSFQIADVRAFSIPDGGPFDFILVNSLLHHLSTDDVEAILHHLRSLLSDDGTVHILELVLPPDASVARTLARWDRGKFARPLSTWVAIFEKFFKTDVLQPYSVKIFGTTVTSMVYFKGGAR
jgi:trans-aconitate methyltransferase